MMIAALMLATLVCPQDQTSPPKSPKFETEAAQLLRDLDVLILQTKAAQDAAAAALRQAKRVERRANELKGLLVALAPSSKADPLDTIRARIMEASSDINLPAGEAALLTVEQEMQADQWKAKPGAAAMLAFARYRISENLQVQAEETGADREKLLARALQKLDAVLVATATTDVLDSGEGSSLRAAALVRVVQANDKLAAMPGALEQHRKAADDAMGALRRKHQAATMFDGQLCVEAARGR